MLPSCKAWAFMLGWHVHHYSQTLWIGEQMLATFCLAMLFLFALATLVQSIVVRRYVPQFLSLSRCHRTCDSIVHIQMHTCFSEPEGCRINQDSTTSHFQKNQQSVSFNSMAQHDDLTVKFGHCSLAGTLVYTFLLSSQILNFYLPIVYFSCSLVYWGLNLMWVILPCWDYHRTQLQTGASGKLSTTKRISSAADLYESLLLLDCR